ncbi:succinate dehydrogenase, hydrophobic membrane anchor protein [Dyella agri]|uniref:Succinate dehydrogenase hydrophobic membrane anchor subunit n=1 Tax=Dyella agri TaxID=1926869 RepID=A0ABW8KGS6_9GAMM
MSEWKRGDPLQRNQPGGRATALHRSIGLGSAKAGASHWWLQRATAVALIPLLMWFLAALVSHARAGHAELVAWLARPVTAVLMILLLVAMFQHLRLGLQVVAEDYVHADRIRFAVTAAIHGISYALMTAGIFAVLLIALR